jgi:transcriptional regulator with XRE-family HTH domain
MDFHSLPDKAVSDELGRRFKTLRLQKNITQQALAQATTLSLNTIKAFEAGQGKLSTLIAVLRVLGELDQLEKLLADRWVGRLQQAPAPGKHRLRATGKRRQRLMHPVEGPNNA